MKNANYRKNNDRTMNSSTYHKKDGTSIRNILKNDADEEIKENFQKNNLSWEEKAVEDYYYEDELLDDEDYDEDYLE